MSSIVAEMFGTTTDAPANQTMAVSAIQAASANATAYLAATLKATTPELRRTYSEYLTQSLLAQEALVNLAIKKGWAIPYETPQQQLSAAYNLSRSVLEQRKD